MRGSGRTGCRRANGGILPVSAQERGENISFSWKSAVFDPDDGTDEGVASSMDVCDVSVAELTIPEWLAGGGYVDPERPFFYENVRPHVLNELALCDDRAGTIGEIDQDIERPAAERNHAIPEP